MGSSRHKRSRTGRFMPKGEVPPEDNNSQEEKKKRKSNSSDRSKNSRKKAKTNSKDKKKKTRDRSKRPTRSSRRTNSEDEEDSEEEEEEQEVLLRMTRRTSSRTRKGVAPSKDDSNGNSTGKKKKPKKKKKDKIKKGKASNKKNDKGKTRVKDKKTLSRKGATSERKKNEPPRGKFKSISSDIRVCKNCGLSVPEGTFTLGKFWQEFELLCETNTWPRSSHRHFMNAVEDTGYSEKNIKLALKAAKNTGSNSHDVESYPCPYDKCEKKFSVFAKLLGHVSKIHDKTETGFDETNVVRSGHMIRRDESERTRRGLTPLIPIKNVFNGTGIVSTSSAQHIIPERLCRIGIVNGVISKNAASLRGLETGHQINRRCQPYYTSPGILHAALIQKVSMPFGLVSLTNGSIQVKPSMSSKKKFSKIPLEQPPPPSGPPEPSWMIKAWDILSKIENNLAGREKESGERSLNDPFKQVGVLEASENLSDDSTDEKAKNEYEMVLDMVNRIDKKVGPGMPLFLQKERPPIEP